MPATKIVRTAHGAKTHVRRAVIESVAALAALEPLPSKVDADRAEAAILRARGELDMALRSFHLRYQEPQ